ncbi:hypothetical protein [Sporomusa aerivorans]|uniref:hypothetical protein n=1 Tax=Sporomusa aerivorans TaxID=204936 RepID=UPI00352A958B
MPRISVCTIEYIPVKQKNRRYVADKLLAGTIKGAIIIMSAIFIKEFLYQLCWR